MDEGSWQFPAIPFDFHGLKPILTWICSLEQILEKYIIGYTELVSGFPRKPSSFRLRLGATSTAESR